MRRLIVVLALATLAACSGSKTKSKDNVAIPNPLEDLQATATIAVDWKSSVKSDAKLGQRMAAAISGDSIFFAGSAGDVRAINKTTGKVIWTTKLDKALSAGPGVDGSRVVVGTLEGEVIALDAKDGEVLWSGLVTSEILAAPLPTSSRIIVRSNDGLVHALDPSDGKVVWKLDRDVPLLTLRGAAQPVADDQNVYVPIDSGKILALKLSDGAIVWERAVNVSNGRTELERMTDIDGAVALVNGDLFVAGYNGQTANLSAASGEQVWNYNAGSIAGLSVSESAVYVTDSTSNVIALDRRSGAELWKQTKLLNRALSAPAVSGDFVIVADFDGYVHAVKKESGDIVGRARTSGPVLTAPVSDGTSVYILSTDGTLMRFSAR